MWKKRPELVFLRNNPIFHVLSNKEAEYIKERASQQSLASQDFLVNKEPLPAALAIIRSGKIQIKGQANETLAELQAGDFFGELTLFLEETEPITAIAQQQTELFLFGRKQLEELLQEKPALANKILMNISAILGKRLRFTNNEMEKIQK